MDLDPKIWSVVIGVAVALSGCVSPGQNAAVDCDMVHLREVLNQPNHGNEKLDKLLWWTAYKNCLDGTQLLIDAGAMPTNESLALAAVDGNSKMARLLMEHGAEAGGAIVTVRGFSGISSAKAQAAVDLLNNLERARAAKQVPVTSSPDEAEAPHPPSPNAPPASSTSAPWWTKSDGK